MPPRTIQEATPEHLMTNGANAAANRPMLIVDAEALQNLVNFVAQTPLPMGRDALVQAVMDSARQVSVTDDEAQVDMGQHQQQQIDGTHE
jgi:sulfopyruvate decarboxylase TPP-binding subunit